MLNALLTTFKPTLKTKLSHFPPKTSILQNEQAVTGSYWDLPGLNGSCGVLLVNSVFIRTHHEVKWSPVFRIFHRILPVIRPKSKQLNKTYDWFTSYGDVEWWIKYGWLLPSGGVNTARRVCNKEG